MRKKGTFASFEEHDVAAYRLAAFAAAVANLLALPLGELSPQVTEREFRLRLVFPMLPGSDIMPHRRANTVRPYGVQTKSSKPFPATSTAKRRKKRKAVRDDVGIVPYSVRRVVKIGRGRKTGREETDCRVASLLAIPMKKIHHDERKCGMLYYGTSSLPFDPTGRLAVIISKKPGSLDWFLPSLRLDLSCKFLLLSPRG